MRVIGPENPSARKNSTVRTPPSPAPTTTTCSMQPSRSGLMVSAVSAFRLAGPDSRRWSAHEQRTLPGPQFPALFLSQAAPHPIGFPRRQRIAAALLNHGTALAD